MSGSLETFTTQAWASRRTVPHFAHAKMSFRTRSTAPRLALLQLCALVAVGHAAREAHIRDRPMQLRNGGKRQPQDIREIKAPDGSDLRVVNQASDADGVGAVASTGVVPAPGSAWISGLPRLPDDHPALHWCGHYSHPNQLPVWDTGGGLSQHPHAPQPACMCAVLAPAAEWQRRLRRPATFARDYPACPAPHGPWRMNLSCVRRRDALAHSVSTGRSLGLPRHPRLASWPRCTPCRQRPALADAQARARLTCAGPGRANCACCPRLRLGMHERCAAGIARTL